MKTIFTLLVMLLANYGWAQNNHFAHAYGSMGFDYGHAITSDEDGHIYIAGYFNGQVDFDNSSNIVELSSYGTRDGFILKLDAEGHFIWVKQMACSGSVHIGKVVVNDVGEIYVVGLFSKTMTLDTDSGTTALVSSGNFDAFVLKLDANGNLIWGQAFGSFGRDEAKDIVIDHNGDLLITGGFLRTVDFDNSDNVAELTSFSSDNPDIFLIKLSPEGNFIWVKQFGGTGEDYVESMTLGQSGAIYMTGYYKRGTADFDPGPGTFILPNSGIFDKIFVLKLTADGDFVWAKQTDGFHLTRGNTIEVDPAENVYIGGYFYATQDFDPGDDVHELTSNGLANIFIWKLDTHGNFILVEHIGNSSWSQIYGSARNLQGDIYFIGEFDGVLDFDFTDDEHVMTSVEQSFDMFVLKYNADGSFGGAIPISGQNLIVGRGIEVTRQDHILVTGGFYVDTITLGAGEGALELNNKGDFDAFVYSFSDETLSLKESLLQNTFKYFPNPVSHTLIIESKTVLREISVYNMLGKLVKERSNLSQERIELDLSILSNGVYHVLLKDGNATWPIKIVKQ
ncbi:T9SS type A sorting domain-containing protein [Gelidibacter japonicus]|uniref:T9SS type A sorting domain-containing protein n=1 Tax=Gelidibacter japonicus TaxID=1962232 RepID=UPI0013D79F01|nr:T9SS type A sorting domain-containing protein [Gelidibacter japonicus]